MANHQIDKQYSENLRQLETSDPVHADVNNPLFKQLINNDAYLKSQTAAQEVVLQDASKQLAQLSNLVNTANWGLSLTLDNTAKINAEIAKLDSTKDYILVFDKVYPILSAVVISNKKLTWVGTGGLKALPNFVGSLVDIKNCPNIIIQNLKFDGLAVAKRGIEIEDSPNFLFDNITVSNIGNALIENNVGILVSVRNNNSRILNCTVKNVIGTSVATGINVDNYKDPTSGSQYLLFDNCYIENIQPPEDSDGIKFLQNSVDVHAVVRNCRFIDCAKRGIKSQSNYVTSENNYFLNGMSLGAIDFQRGYGKSINDTAIAITTEPDRFIAISGNNVSVIGATLVSERNTGGLVDGILINNVSGVSAMDTVVIERVKTKGMRFPIQFTTDSMSINILRIKDCEFEDFSGTYVIPTPVPTINTLIFEGNEVRKTGTFYGAINQNTFANYYISKNRLPLANVIAAALDRKNGVIVDNLNGEYEQKDKVRYYRANADPSTLTFGDSSKYYYAKKGDIAYNTTLTILGVAGSRYVIKEWICIADGVASTNKGTWLEVRVPTGS